ncbi:MAG TPA: hypothetical protein VHU83_19685 [Bryobacteraceae bacterium]|jgi:hypothetical protein|nr:hypothetical protein [Bryobacteraceae bacterium]
MQSNDPPEATANTPISILREDFGRIAEQLTWDVEPAIVYSIRPADSGAE